MLSEVHQEKDVCLKKGKRQNILVSQTWLIPFPAEIEFLLMTLQFILFLCFFWIYTETWAKFTYWTNQVLTNQIKVTGFPLKNWSKMVVQCFSNLIRALWSCSPFSVVMWFVSTGVCVAAASWCCVGGRLQTFVVSCQAAADFWLNHLCESDCLCSCCWKWS